MASRCAWQADAVDASILELASSYVASQCRHLIASVPAQSSRPEDIPGQPKSWRTSALEAGQVASQSMRRSFAPVNQIHQHV